MTDQMQKLTKLDMSLKEVTESSLSPMGKQEAKSELEEEYLKCLNKIYSWAIYRKKEAKDRNLLNLDVMR